MRRGGTSTLDVLDDAAAVVRVLFGTWVGALWLGVLPARVLALHVGALLLRLGDEASAHVSVLRGRVVLLVAAMLLAALARAAYVRACHLALEHGRRPLAGSVLRVPAADLAAHLVVTLAGAVALGLAGFTAVLPAVVLVVVAAGIGAAHGSSRPGVLEPLRRALATATASWTPLLLAIACSLAILVAAANVVAGVELATWLASAAGVDASTWDRMTSLHAPAYVAVVLVAAATLVEPLWLGAQVAHVRMLRARETGDDLRAEIERVLGPAPGAA